MPVSEAVVRSRDVMNRQHLQARAALRPLSALTLSALVVAACSGDREPTVEPGSTLAASSTPVATLAPTVTPTPAATSTPDTTGAPAVAATAAPEVVSGTSVAIGDPQPAPELVDLVLADGSPFDLASYEGSNVLVFFGYTHCPDVCPATLGELFGVIDDAPQTQAVFISVDPERDTPEFLEEWTTYMPDNIHAVTGTPGAIRRAADNYGVKYARVETTSTAGYTMSHTADLYLIDASGQMLLAYPFGTSAAEIVPDLQALEAG